MSLANSTVNIFAHHCVDLFIDNRDFETTTLNNLCLTFEEAFQPLQHTGIHACKPSMWVSKLGRSQVQGWSTLRRESEVFVLQ